MSCLTVIKHNFAELFLLLKNCWRSHLISGVLKFAINFFKIAKFNTREIKLNFVDTTSITTI